MSLDSALEAAIRQATKEAGQNVAIAERMIAWLEALGEGDVPPEQEDGFYARLIGAVDAGGTSGAN